MPLPDETINDTLIRLIGALRLFVAVLNGGAADVERIESARLLASATIEELEGVRRWLAAPPANAPVEQASRDLTV